MFIDLNKTFLRGYCMISCWISLKIPWRSQMDFCTEIADLCCAHEAITWSKINDEVRYPLCEGSLQRESEGSHCSAHALTMLRVTLVLFIIVGRSYSEEIDFLPGSEGVKINFKHYSGFFKVSETHFLHYWYVRFRFFNEWNWLETEFSTTLNISV